MLLICIPSKPFMAVQGTDPRPYLPCFEGIILNLQLLSEDCFQKLETERKGLLAVPALSGYHCMKVQSV